MIKISSAIIVLMIYIVSTIAIKIMQKSNKKATLLSYNIDITKY